MSAERGETGGRMAVARLHGVGDLRVEDEPIPSPGQGESLVRMTAVGLCGSDLHWYAEGAIGDAHLDRPLVLGHEFAGVIEDGPRAGQRVAVDPAIPCGDCRTCHTGYGNLCPRVRFAGHGLLDGALRGYLTWPTSLLYPLPDALSDPDGAMLEPLGVALHAIDLGHVRVGASVAVIGCGPIGLLLVQLARVAGAASVIAVEPLPHRAEAARRLGAERVHSPSVADAGGAAVEVDGAAEVDAVSGMEVDVAFEVAGTQAAVEAAMAAVRPGGRVVLVGIPDDDRTTFTASVARRKGLTIAVSRRMNHVYPRAIRLVEQGRVNVRFLVTDRYPLARAGAALEAAAARTGLKVVVTG